MTKKKIVRKSRVEKPYNHGTMSKAAFWSMIKSALRQKSRWWKPIQECKKAAKRPYKGANKRQKFEYQCANCEEWFPDKQISIDHIIPVGSLNDYDDLPGFVERLFCEIDFLQPLCNDCHSAKTKKDIKEIRNGNKN